MMGDELMAGWLVGLWFFSSGFGGGGLRRC
jgi:hypothetical protein